MEPKKKNSQNCYQRILCVYHAIKWNVELWTGLNFIYKLFMHISIGSLLFPHLYCKWNTLSTTTTMTTTQWCWQWPGHNRFIHDFKWNARLRCSVYAYRRNVSMTMERKRWMTTQNHIGRNRVVTDNVTSVALTLVLYMKFGVRLCCWCIFFSSYFSLDVSFIH